MNNKDFSKMAEDKKVIFFLGISGKVIPVFSRAEDQENAQNAIDVCWDWLESKENIGDVLYNLLDDEYSGITLIQEMSEIEKDKVAWNCIIDAVAYTSRKAFENEKVKYFPEPIELVDDTLVNHFINCFKDCVLDSEEYIKNMNSFLEKYNIAETSNLKAIIRDIL